jgi:hypothetical protein
LNKKVVLAVVFVGLISLAAVHDARSQFTGAIFINPDGSVSGTDKIQRDGNLYSLVDNIYNSSIVVQCNNIVIDGAGFTLQGPAPAWPTPAAINLTCSNVTVENFNIIGWEVGILGAYNGNTITNNNVTGNERDIAIYADNYNVTRNYIAQADYGVRIIGNNNTISQNQIVEYGFAFWITSSSRNIITANNITFYNQLLFDTDYGGFQVYHDNFFNPGRNIGILSTYYGPQGGTGVTMPPWDDGYPSGGNYWSDYASRYPNATEVGSSGIGDTQYLISVSPNVVDRYPLIAPFNISAPTIGAPPPNPSPSPTVSQPPSSSPSPTVSPSPTISETTPIMLLAAAVGAAVAAILIKKKQVRTTRSI